MEEEALREAMEDAFLEGAAQWRADTILQTLQMDKLDAWIRQEGLGGDIEALKSEIDEVMATVSYVKGRAVGNRRLARSLAAIKQKLFDADDAVDELDYYRLQQQVELEGAGQYPLLSSSNAHNRFASDGVIQSCTAATVTNTVTLHEPEGMHEAARVDHGTSRGDGDIIPPRTGRGKKRSPHWVDFDEIYDTDGKTVGAECRHCKKKLKYDGKQGPRVLMTHSNSAKCKNTREARPQPPSHSSMDDATENATPVAVSNSPSIPRMGTNPEPTQITAAVAHPWNKDEISSKIQKITHQLQGIRGDVTKDLNMFGSHSGASSVLHQSTASDPCRRTSSLLQGKVYGRDKEKSSIIKLMTTGKSDSVTVVPIVGIGGTGKTALAQFVYNDPKVQDHFDHSIWVWVSNNFDEMVLTREILDIVPREKHEGLCSLDKLQQVLKTHIESKRVLLILDDVWDDKNIRRLDLILAPFKSDNPNGNVILVTTRNLSVAKRIGMTEPVVLGALEDDELWLLLKARAFGKENYEEHGNLTIIGQEIAGKLKGNPLAAVTAGELLRVDLTVDHWNKILKDEDWKLLGLSGGIMASLKRSYDQLPYHLHQCFSYCSIFPDSYKFLGEELVRIWISQGFVQQSHPSKKLEEIGMDYLADLVNMGYFQQVGREISYVLCGLMHDFARMVSKTDCAIIDGLQCNDILLTVQHLSIVWSTYPYWNTSQINKFIENLRNTIAPVVTKLRSLVFIGHYKSSFFQSFQDIFRKAPNLRLLQISATFADFNSLMCSSVNPTHLRYLKLTANEARGGLPQVLSNFCHLQVLDVGSSTHLDVPDGMNNLVSLRHLVATSIDRIGKLTSLQTLNNFSVQDSNGFQIIELQCMNDLVQLGVSQLQNVKTQEEACGAGLLDKWHLEKLHLSWEDINLNILDVENVTCSEPSTSIETEECLQKEVLEGLQPHENLKHLQIFGYNGATSPSWLSGYRCNISVTSLQTLHLENCRKWRILPSLQLLPLLRKLKLSGMPKVVKISVPSLEELVLVKMKKLETCSCTYMRGLNSCLRVLKIKNCTSLKVFDLFGDGHKFKTEKKSWLPRIWELVIHNCPLLLVPHPLPSSSIVSRISMRGVSNFPSIEASSFGSLIIGKDPGRSDYYEHEYDSNKDRFEVLSDEPLVLDGKILAFHNLSFLTELIIGYCRNLMFISLEGLSQLVSLKTLRIVYCPGISSFDVPPEHAREDLTAAKYNAIPSLKHIMIRSCGIAWEWLSLIVQYAPALTELDVQNCPELESLQLNSCTALQKLKVCTCESLGTLDVLQSRSLCIMEVRGAPNLKSLRLHSCTALLMLDIRSCTSLSTLEGFQSLGSLMYLYLRECPCLHSCLEGLPVQDYELCPQLKYLSISDFSFLATSFCKQLTSLQSLEISGFEKETPAEGLTDEEETGLLLLSSLTELRFMCYKYLKRSSCRPAQTSLSPGVGYFILSEHLRIAGPPAFSRGVESLPGQ
ncbi:putative disease resistance protein RGA4 isoform X1 [Triticum urartu]|uniref:BED-type domain-containing protein n=1 Tax=Triticum urartu TaxID=4572 RepID=A0A8R7TDB5_TRIUA|nr:putative disease resistance protein RGA4 isoform X1 [Triticum urartu]